MTHENKNKIIDRVIDFLNNKPLKSDMRMAAALIEELKLVKTCTIADISSRLFFEELIWNKKFPDEEFDADNFYDWAAENANEAFNLCLDVARDLGF